MNDGGPAFPKPWEVMRESGGHQPGMSLRDYFAAKAMQAFITNLRPEVDGMGYILPSQWRPVVSASWKIADEMLADREKSKTENRDSKIAP